MIKQGMVPDLAAKVFTEVTAEVTAEIATEVVAEVLVKLAGETELKLNYSSGNP